MLGTKSNALYALIALMSALEPSLWAQDRMHAGLWETTVTSSDGKSATRTSCLSAADAAASNQGVQALRESMEKALSTNKGSCKVTVKNFTPADYVITTQVDCGAISYGNTTTYKGDTVETVIIHVNAGVTKRTVNISRRVGACK